MKPSPWRTNISSFENDINELATQSALFKGDSATKIASSEPHKNRIFKGRKSWDKNQESALREHYQSGTCTNEVYAESVGRPLKSIEAKAVRMKIKRSCTARMINHPAHYYQSGTYQPNEYTTRHIL